MNKAYAPGPWYAKDAMVASYAAETNGQTLAHAIDDATAERIAACVTACEGLDPEAVTDLLEACEMAASACVAEGRGYEEDPLWRTLNSAIRKAKGE